MTDVPGGPRRQLGVAVIGFGWMGRVHAQAYARTPHHYPDLAVSPVLTVVADDVPGRAQDAASQFGFARATNDWRDIASDPAIEAVSITAPNFLHREIAVELAKAGKHIWIEKPVGLNVDDAVAVGDAVSQAGVESSVGFNYRNAPAVEHARRLIASGAIGPVTHARIRMFSDYAAHPNGALTWRFERRRGGNGVLGDLMSHGADLARFLLGEIDSLVADTALFIPQRPKPTGATAGHTRAEGGEPGPVENDDYASCLARLNSGARLVLEVSRVSVGEQNSYGFEVHGTRGAVFWDFRRMGELRIGLGDLYQDQPVSSVFVDPSHGELRRFQPGSGISMGYDDLKVIECARFLDSIATGRSQNPTLHDAICSAKVVAAIERSTDSGRWEEVG